MNKAVIVGCNGQDGRLLNDLLRGMDYVVLGIDRDFIKCPPGYYFGPIDINNAKDVNHLIDAFQPTEIYYLAAYHHSSEDVPPANIELFRRSYDVHVAALVNFLEGIRQYSPRTKIFYAASSHIFGEPDRGSQDENTPINPNCIYGITKAAGLFSCRSYRNNHSVFASVGILYNHESPFRGSNFISKKIITGAINIKLSRQEKLIIGNLSHEIDWGYAPDYVDAMHKILNHGAPDDFVVATGKKNSVLDFVRTAFEHLGLDWKPYVEENHALITKKSPPRVGNSDKLMDATGWKPSVNFSEMIHILVDEILLDYQ